MPQDEKIKDESKAEVASQVAPVERIDEYAIDQFKALGYDEPLPLSLTKTYKAFKMRRDRLYPGRLSPEGFALVALLSDVTTGKLKL